MRKIAPLFVAAGLLCAPLALRAANAVKDVVVIDFLHMPRDPGGAPTRAYEYAWNDWEDKRKVAQIAAKGLLINHVSGKGLVGENRGLDFRKHSKARIDLVIGNGNAATLFVFSLADRDGTECVWEIPLADQAKGVPLSLLVDLQTPSRVEKPGKTSGLDLKKLRWWHLGGNYQDAPVELLITKVTAVSG